MIQIHADFNNSTEDDKVRLITIGSLRDIDQHKEELREGVTVLLSDGDVEVEACLERDDNDEMWLGVPDWKTLRHVT